MWPYVGRHLHPPVLEDDFDTRPEFTDAEILRTNLASVILQMTAAGLGDIEKFPFIDPPDHRNIRDGVQLLQELGALDPSQKDVRKRLTDTGRKLAQLPVDPGWPAWSWRPTRTAVRARSW